MILKRVSFTCAYCKATKYALLSDERGSNGSFKITSLDGHTINKTQCYDCRLICQKKNRKRSGNLWTKKYEKTKKGFIMRTYRNMLSRVSGVQKKSAHLYVGLSICDREVFYQMSLKDQSFKRLFKEWVSSGYQRKMTPSVNRKKTSIGYTLENIEWITQSVNSSLGSSSPSRDRKKIALKAWATRVSRYGPTGVDKAYPHKRKSRPE